jgi:hopanoid C-3 methylase
MSNSPVRKWKVLLVHPSALMYSEVYLRLEPLGLELVAQACRAAGYAVRLLDLQYFSHHDYIHLLADWKPDAIGFSLNYLANIPEVVDLAKETRLKSPRCFIFAGGHSASFTAREILEHAAGAIDCVVRGEGEEITPRLLALAEDDREHLHSLPGVVSLRGQGPAPKLVDDLDAYRPARDLLAKRRKYFIGVLDPSASIEFTRGCPWDCVFCSAWTFYGRSYRKLSPEVIAQDLAGIREPGVFIVDDVASIQPEQGFAIGREIERRRIKKHYDLETRGDVLLRDVSFIAGKCLARGQTNFVRMLWKFNQVYSRQRQLSDHQRNVRYETHPPETTSHTLIDPASLYVHTHVPPPTQIQRKAAAP